MDATAARLPDSTSLHEHSPAKDLAGPALVTIEHAARPGEKYEQGVNVAAAGEPMYCVPYRNKSVKEVRALLKDRGLMIAQFIHMASPQPPTAEPEVTTSVPDSMLR
ncbi:hypothetical protein [[Actinomadura] parvosata]|uniref:hypothetical protein n=1 Tax=[Actinomadura] parvosata TaxID=1955412 RepID=UPI001649127C